MNPHDEHDDDLEPEVIEGAEIETEHYDEAEDVEESPGGEGINPVGRAGGGPAEAEEEEPHSEGSDTI